MKYAAALHWLHAGVWILGGSALLGCVRELPFPWFLAAVAMIFYAKGAWCAYLAVRREAYERDPTLVIARAERIYAAGSIATICLCVVSLFRGEGVLGGVAIVFVILHAALHVSHARRSRLQANSELTIGRQ